MLSPRSIAMQGLGRGARHTALQGLVPETAAPPFVGGGGRPMRDVRRREDEDVEVLLYIVAAAVAAGVIH